MSEVQSRSAPAARGRGGVRGGRGGFGGRSEGRPNRTNGAKDTAASFDDDADVGQLRKQYNDSLPLVKAIFPDWSDADILYALQETNGDVEEAVTRIADGTISQWGEVSKAKKPKAKDTAASSGLTDSTNASRPSRGGRSEGGRGRGRATERGRGGRGRTPSSHVPATNGQHKENQKLSIPTEEAADWGAPATQPTDEVTTSATEPAPVAPSKPAESAPVPKTWASMLRQSAPPKPAPKPKEPAPPKPEAIAPLPPVEPSEPEPAVAELAAEPVEELAAAEAPKVVEPEVALPPPEDDLTKNNLEQLPDESHPPATATAASTTADSWDPRASQLNPAVTPLSASQAQHQTIPKPLASGFAASALKATERPTRMPSYQRRLLEQEEAVRMPGNREVDRAAVQFGAFNLSGGEEDIDGDREDAETRAQPPADSPVAVPRATLPPVSQPAAVPEGFSATQKPAGALPQTAGPAASPAATPTGPSALSSQPTPPTGPSSQQYGRFGQPNVQDQSSSFSQKPYESFGQPATTSAGNSDSFPAPTTQAPSQQPGGAFSSAPSEYSSYYTADQQNRNAYNNYYQHYGQSGQEGPGSQRPFGGYGSQQSDNLSQYPQSAGQSRYGAGSAAGAGAAASASDTQNSGHNTPNPTSQNQQAGQNQPSNTHQQPHGNQGYPYNHPYYSSPYYSAYMNQQYGGGYGGGFGGAPYGKGNPYGQPHQYGMSPHGPYDHAASPAASGGFGASSLHGRDSGLGSSIGDYGRAGSAQSGSQPSIGNTGFGGVHDSFGRAGSGYGSQAGQGYSNPGAQGNTGSNNDDLKPYGAESKGAGGPSPSLASAARPGSAANNTSSQSSLPPPQGGQQGIGAYGGYPSHLQQGHGLHGNQTGGSGYGLGGGAGGQHNSPYGSYGNQGFGGYGGYGRQGGGWGGNYH